MSIRMTAALTHDALVYGSMDTYIGTVVPFLREGIANGEGTVVATHERNRDAIARALGPAADDVMFVPSSEVYRSPHAAIGAYHAVLGHFAREGRPSVRAIGEVDHGPPAEHDRWLRYESIAHSVFEDEALHVICPYDARALPARLIEHARRTHPTQHDPHGRTPSPSFEPPEDVFAAIPAVEPLPAGPADLALNGVQSDLGRARLVVADAVGRALPRARADEALVAIGEVMANALRHGDGPTAARLWLRAGDVTCRVTNDGPPIADACAGYRPPADPEHGGMGLWIARQLADELWIGADARGPIVTLAFRG